MLGDFVRVQEKMGTLLALAPKEFTLVDNIR
jgi:hypothetical protein